MSTTLQSVGSRVLVIDNYDSFVYILVQYLGELGIEPIVFRNDKVTIDQIEDINPDSFLISPGPGTPADAGLCLDLIANFKSKKPIFGVCLGLQCIGQAFGGEIIRAPNVMHGKTSSISQSTTLQSTTPYQKPDMVWAIPRSLAATRGVSVDFFS